MPTRADHSFTDCDGIWVGGQLLGKVDAGWDVQCTRARREHVLLTSPVLPVKTDTLISIVKLVKNFRSHASILQYPNDCFYNNDLEACGNQDVNAFIGSTLLPNPKYSIIFHAISGLDQREANSPSYFNVDEVLQVKAYVEELRRRSAGENTLPELIVLSCTSTTRQPPTMLAS